MTDFVNGLDLAVSQGFISIEQAKKYLKQYLEKRRY